MKTVRSIRGLALAGVASLGLIAMTPALADSEFDTGNGTLTATADLDFQIVIPRFLYLQVGAPGSTETLVTFDLSGVSSIADVDSQIGSGSPVDGDVTVGVRLVSNAGDIELEATGSGTGLTNGSETIAWSQITGTAADGTGAGGLDVPTIGAPAVTITASSGVVNRDDTWSFDYLNDNLVAGGTYTGTVTYTATAP